MKRQTMLILGIMLAGICAPLHAMEQPERKNISFDYQEWQSDCVQKNSELLLEAIKSGNVQEAKALIKSGQVDINVKDKKVFTLGLTPLISAVRKRSPELVHLLIVAGADINATGTRDGATPLVWAAGLGEREITHMLIAAGANVNIVFEGKTSLFWAGKNGHLEIAHLLIPAMLKLTKEQKDSVYALIASLERTPELKTNKDTRRLIAQDLIDMYKEENRAKVRAEIEKIDNIELKKQLLQLVEGK